MIPAAGTGIYRACSRHLLSSKAPDFWLGVNWEDSDLCKALASKGVSTEASKEKSEASSAAPKQSPSVNEKVENTASESVVDDVPMNFDEFDDSIPF